MKGKLSSWVLSVFLLGLVNCPGTTFLQFDSTYLGDGWFQYRLQMMNDPFFTEVEVVELGIGFTNQIDHSTSSQNWTNTGYGIGFSNYVTRWSFSQANPATRPYEEVFLVRSAETSWRMGTNGFGDGALIILSMILTEFNPLTFEGSGSGPTYSQNVVGYANFPCLVPCAPEAADGSPTNFSFALKLLPDISIQHLLQSDGMISGVDFLWDYQSTVLLQASTDMKQWTNVAYIWTDPPGTTWTTNTPLNDFGKFFRLALVGNGHLSNLPPLNSNALLAKMTAARPKLAASTAIPRVSGCRMSQGKMAVTVATQPDQHYTVSALDNHRIVRATQSLTATGTSATACFDPGSLPTPVFFQVSATPAP